MQKKLRFISTPAHGWLEVPSALLARMDIDSHISHYSYANNEMAYLEEDCDAQIFYRRFEDMTGAPPVVEAIYQETTPITNYKNY